MDGLSQISIIRSLHGLRNPDSSVAGPFAVPTNNSLMCSELQQNKYFRPFCKCIALDRMGRTTYGFECNTCKRQLDWKLTPIPRGSR